MLSAISQRKKNTTWYHFYVESKKKKKSNSKLESRMVGTRMSWSDRERKRG